MLVAVDAVCIRMGGGARLLLDFLEWLPKVRPEWEWAVYLLPRRCREFDDPPPRKGVEIVTVPIGDSALGRLWWLYSGLPGRLARTGADVIFAFANVATLRPPVPQVVYVHQRLAFSSGFSKGHLSFKEAKLRLLRALILHGALRSTAVIVQTQDMRQRLERAAPRLAGRIHVIPGCVSLADSSTGIRPEKRHLIDGASSPRLVYVAHAGQHKNHLRLIRAMPGIIAHCPSATLLLTIGPDDPSNHADARYARSVRRLAETLAVSRHIAWLGVLTAAEVRYLLRRATVAVFPSLEESFGLPLAQAITEGCVLAASDLPFAREVAAGAALYFDPLDPSSIAQSITRLLGSPELVERMRNEARRHRDRFHPRTVAEQIAVILEAAARPAYSETNPSVAQVLGAGASPGQGLSSTDAPSQGVQDQTHCTIQG